MRAGASSAFLFAAVIAATACSLQSVDLTGKTCPCASGWRGDAERLVCVRGTGPPGDGGGGGEDGGEPDDGGRRDGARTVARRSTAVLARMRRATRAGRSPAARRGPIAVP